MKINIEVNLKKLLLTSSEKYITTCKSIKRVPVYTKKDGLDLVHYELELEKPKTYKKEEFLKLFENKLNKKIKIWEHTIEPITGQKELVIVLD